MIFFKTPILKMIRNQLRKERMERSSHTTRFMNISLKDSQTKYNLMRAFAGESQARNRYTFASELAHQKKLPLLEQLFKFTADQEKAHAKVFYDFLKDCTGENILIDGSYPVDYGCDVAFQLEKAHHNEYEEYETIYPHFASIAEQEGFAPIAHAFREIAKVEKVHGDRFEYYYQLLKNDTLFTEKPSGTFMCLNCGYIYEGETAPTNCPVCKEEQGYFIRIDEAPFQR